MSQAAGWSVRPSVRPSACLSDGADKAALGGRLARSLARSRELRNESGKWQLWRSRPGPNCRTRPLANRMGAGKRRGHIGRPVFCGGAEQLAIFKSIAASCLIKRLIDAPPAIAACNFSRKWKILSLFARIKLHSKGGRATYLSVDGDASGAASEPTGRRPSSWFSSPLLLLLLLPLLPRPPASSWRRATSSNSSRGRSKWRQVSPVCPSAEPACGARRLAMSLCFWNLEVPTANLLDSGRPTLARCPRASRAATSSSCATATCPWEASWRPPQGYSPSCVRLAASGPAQGLLSRRARSPSLEDSKTPGPRRSSLTGGPRRGPSL